jgi:hypothetical protein
MSRSMSVIGIVAAVIALAGCSDPSSTLGGDVVPAQRSFEEYPHARSDLTGEVELRSDGCWTADVGDGPLVAIFPVGSTLEQIDGVWHFVSDDGLSLTSGDRFVGSGGIAPVGDIPGFPDGFWGSYLTFCDPTAENVLVLDSIDDIGAGEASIDQAILVDAASTSLDAAWPCGLGFTIASPSQRVAIYLHPVDTSSFTDPPVELPDPTWRAELVVGEDLLVNHCDDVVEPDEPERVVTATFPITSGRLDFTPPGSPCDGTEVVGDLTGSVAEGPLGPVTLPDLHLVNTAYGCFAG